MQLPTLAFGFVLGTVYISIGVTLLMLIDTRTRRVEAFTRNNDYWLFFLLVVWPAFLPFLFLPRYRIRGGAIRL